MDIQKPFAVVPKYFEDFHNYFNNAKEKLVSYTYAPEYLRNQTEKNTEASIKVFWDKECLLNLTNKIV